MIAEYDFVLSTLITCDFIISRRKQRGNRTVKAKKLFEKYSRTFQYAV